MIPVQNIYYMLSYAFRALQAQSYRQVAAESFDHAADLLAAILCKGVSIQLKRGLCKEYVSQTEPLSTVRGRMDVTASLKRQTLLRRQIICTYDAFSEDCRMNEILKSTMLLFLHASIVSKERKRELRRLLAYFDEVSEMDLRHVDWQFRYRRNNRQYQMLIAICELAAKGLLQTQADGAMKVMEFLDEQSMCQLYEKFLLAYYQTEFPQMHASAAWILWQLDDEARAFLPMMQSDVLLTYGRKTLILDAKYYQNALSFHYGKHVQHSANLYQIFTYVKNKEAELSGQPHEVAGLLLYAKTEEDILPDADYHMSGNRISVRSLDLNQSFSVIRQQLNGIAKEYFGV